MKKLILVLVILLAVPALGLNLTLTRQGTTAYVDVNYTGGDPNNMPRAFALKLDINTPATFQSISNYKTGESTQASPGYGIYPARIAIDTNGTVTSWGTPLADPCDPGAGTGLYSNSIVLEFGSLYYGDVNKPRMNDRLCTVEVNCNGGTSAVNITATEENTYRGGVVLENGSVPVPDLNATLAYTGCQPSECLKSSLPDGNEYPAWVTWGKPSCWCFRRQCNADANGGKTGPYWVSTPELNLLKVAYNKTDTQLKNITNGVCCDFDHKKTGPYRVTTPDLNILKAKYNKLDTAVKCCDLNQDCNLESGDKYNFWTN